jgi:hypothetical protein
MIKPCDLRPPNKLDEAEILRAQETLDRLLYLRWDGERAILPLAELSDRGVPTRWLPQILPCYAACWRTELSAFALIFRAAPLGPSALSVPRWSVVPHSWQDAVELSAGDMELTIDERALRVYQAGYLLLEAGLHPWGVLAGDRVLDLLCRLQPLLRAAKLDLAFELSDD